MATASLLIQHKRTDRYCRLFNAAERLQEGIDDNLGGFVAVDGIAHAAARQERLNQRPAYCFRRSVWPGNRPSRHSGDHPYPAHLADRRRSPLPPPACCASSAGHAAQQRAKHITATPGKAAAAVRCIPPPVRPPSSAPSISSPPCGACWLLHSAASHASQQRAQHITASRLSSRTGRLPAANQHLEQLYCALGIYFSCL